MKTDIDIKNFKQKIKAVRNLRKPLLKPLRKAASVIQSATKRNVKKNGFTGGELLKYIKRKEFKHVIGLRVYLQKTSILFEKGTKIRKTKKGYNRGKILGLYFLYQATKANEQTVINYVKQTKLFD